MKNNVRGRSARVAWLVVLLSFVLVPSALADVVHVSSKQTTSASGYAHAVSRDYAYDPYVEQGDYHSFVGCGGASTASVSGGLGYSHATADAEQSYSIGADAFTGSGFATGSVTLVEQHGGELETWARAGASGSALLEVFFELTSPYTARLSGGLSDDWGERSLALVSLSTNGGCVFSASDYSGDFLFSGLLLPGMYTLECLASVSFINYPVSGSAAYGYSLQLTPVVPEPSTLFLLGAGAVGLLAGRRRGRCTPR